MRVLLDTHAAVWWWTEDDRLSPVARAVMASRATQVLVSAATAMEVATKHRIGKWPDAGIVMAEMPALIRLHRFVELPISSTHAAMAGTYAWDHKDPFDRLLAAQAETEGVPLVSGDVALRRLGVAVIWRPDDLSRLH